MQIFGEWYLCDDDVERPIIRGEILGGDGAWAHVEHCQARLSSRPSRQARGEIL